MNTVVRILRMYFPTSKLTFQHTYIHTHTPSNDARTVNLTVVLERLYFFLENRCANKWNKDESLRPRTERESDFRRFILLGQTPR